MIWRGLGATPSQGLDELVYLIPSASRSAGVHLLSLSPARRSYRPYDFLRPRDNFLLPADHVALAWSLKIGKSLSMFPLHQNAATSSLASRAECATDLAGSTIARTHT